MMVLRFALWYRISRAWISMSMAVPCAPPSGWWIMMRALGIAYRLPGAPEHSSIAPMDAARPKHTVDTSARHSCMAS